MKKGTKKVSDVEKAQVRDAVLSAYRKLSLEKPLLARMFSNCLKSFSERAGETLHVQMNKNLRKPELVIGYPFLVDKMNKISHEKFVQLVFELLQHEMYHLVLKQLDKLSAFTDKKFMRLYNIAADEIINSSRFVNMSECLPAVSFTTHLTAMTPSLTKLVNDGVTLFYKGEEDSFLPRPFSTYNAYDLALYYSSLPEQKKEDSDQEESDDNDQKDGQSSEESESSDESEKESEEQEETSGSDEDESDSEEETSGEEVDPNDPDFKNWMNRVTSGQGKAMEQFEIAFNLRKTVTFSDVFRHKVNSFVRSAEHATRLVVSDRTRLSRRFPNYLTVPGHKRIYVNPKNVYIWVDISGSMDLEKVKLFLVNIDKVLTSEQKVTIIIYNDSYVEHFSHKKGSTRTIKNGGGTDLGCSFAEVKKLGILSKPSDCVHILYTDCKDCSIKEELVSSFGKAVLLVYPEGEADMTKVNLFKDNIKLPKEVK